MSKGQKIEPRRLKGFQDYLPETMAKRFRIMDIVRNVSTICGFEPVGTPALEYAEVLLGQGAETDKQVFRFEDNGGREVALRFDLTVPFARFVAEHQSQLQMPFKRLQIGDVWRAEKPQKGRYREFCQCDLDIIGVDSAAADMEILICISKILDALNFGPYTITVSDRMVLNGLITHCLPEINQSLRSEVLIALDKLEKIGADRVAELIVAIPGASAGGANLLLSWLNLRDNEGNSDLNLVREKLSDDNEVLIQCDRFEQTINVVRTVMSGTGLGKLVLDLSVARGLGYYTGIVYETKLDEAKQFGSISSGGRYDNLAERFGQQHLPGVGGSIGLDRLIAAIQDLGKGMANHAPDVFIAVADESSRQYAYEIAESLRTAEIRTDLALKPGKLANQFKYADKRRIPLVVTVGTEENNNRTYSLKTMATGEEKRGLQIESIAATVRQMLSHMADT